MAMQSIVRKTMSLLVFMITEKSIMIETTLFSTLVSVGSGFALVSLSVSRVRYSRLQNLASSYRC